MRVAALYDIHGNLPALEAVLRQASNEADTIVVGGDVLPGPMPRECLDLLLSIEQPVHFIRGNGEVAVLEMLSGKLPSKVPQAYHPVIRHNVDQLEPQHCDWIASWPKTLVLSDVFFCHATPRDDNEIFTRLTPESVLLPIFAPVKQPLVFCGHTHMQFDRKVGNKRVLNAGSVGMPFGGSGAYWLLLDTEIEFRRTEYDLLAAAQTVRMTGYPRAEEFADCNILHPPSETVILEDFKRAELK